MIKTGSDPLAVRWVADFKPLNVALKRLVWGSESSDQLMRHISPTTRDFCTEDTISGYHQIPLDKESRDLLTIITQYGTFQYNTMAQGICSASDLFNMLTDGNTKLDVEEWSVLKNMTTFYYEGRQLNNLRVKW